MGISESTLSCIYKTFIFLFMFLSGNLSAQLFIYDQSTGQGIAEVTIVLPDQSVLFSDRQGFVKTDFTDTLLLSLSHMAYNPKQILVYGNDSVSIALVPRDIVLDEVLVSPFESGHPVLIQPLALNIYHEEQLQRFNTRSLSDALSSASGVKIEERATASYRISIRGSSLRAPFGVRNVKLFWNDLPFTSADGSSPLNAIDPEMLKQVEIIKGPAGSIYGAGNGGVVKLNSLSRSPENSLGFNVKTGAFGMLRAGMDFHTIGENKTFSGGFQSLQSNGYRDHSSIQRQVFHFSPQWYPSEKLQIAYHMLYSRLKYELPGGLTFDEWQENPRLSRPGSIEQNSSVFQKYFLHGLSANTQIANQWQNRSTLSFSILDFDHPFILDYKKDMTVEATARTVFEYNSRNKHLPFRWIFGAAYQQAGQIAQNFGNMGGTADTIRFSDQIGYTQFSFFNQIEIRFHQHWLLSAGLSLNYLSYNIHRLVDAISQNTYTFNRTFDIQPVPRVALSRQLSPNAALFLQWSNGFSPPGLNEIRTNEGSLNHTLQPELGMNTELGFRLNAPALRLQTEGSVFYFNLQETITGYANPDGVILFRNSGQTNQFGVEYSIHCQVIDRPSGFLNNLTVSQNYTGHFFSFANYSDPSGDLSGNQLTGVPAHTLYHHLHAVFLRQFALNLHHRFEDAIPLNNQNTAWSEPYHLLGAQVSFTSHLHRTLRLQLQAGIDNILNTSYSSGHDLNAFNGRYYQPAPGRNWYTGFRLTYYPNIEIVNGL